MTTAHHTDIVFGASATPATINDPLGELDAAIVALDTAIAGTALAITTTDAQANSGQKVIPVTATTAFVAGQSIWIGDIAGTYETRVIDTIQAGVSLTVTVNLTNTYAAGKVVSASPSELVEARDAKATLHTRIRSAGGTSGSAFPGSPATNDVCVRTDRGGARYVWSGAAWMQHGVPAATAFWGAPSLYDRCYRTDRGLEYQWDGTRWLSPLYLLPFGPSDVAFGTSVNSVRLTTPSLHGTYDVWLETVDINALPSGTNDGSNYWHLQVRKMTGSSETNLGTEASTAANTVGEWVRKAVAIDALLGVTYSDLNIYASKTGSPGTLYFNGLLRCRIVG